MNRILLLLAAALTMTSIASAQESDTTENIRPNLHLLARSYGDSVVLRWGTTTHTAWKVAGSKGYIVERYELTREATGKPTTLTPSPIKPLSLEEWKARYRPEDTLAGAAVQALYGKPVITSDDPFGSIYELYLQQKNLFGFALLLADMAPRIADGLGLRYVDKSITAGRTYLYRVYSLANNPDEPIDTAFTIVTTSDVPTTPSVTSLRADEGEKQVVLKWDRYEHTVPFTGYYIERSLDGGKSFSRVNSMPFIAAIDESAEGAEGSDEVSYNITVAENYRPAIYRVIGVDAFGETSRASKTITAMGRDRTAPHQPQIMPLKVVDGKSLRLEWRMDSLAADLDGFIVGKSEGVEGPFEPIGTKLPRTAREFVDRDVADLPQHYYTVSAVDTAGNLRSSVPLLGMFPDSIPPATPVALTGTIDSNGVVVLKWKGNFENDLQGYRVFYANQQDHEFQQLTTDITRDTLFADTLTLETLTEEIYYKITALDNNFNHSPFTATLTLKKPDVVAPAPPIVSDMTVSERGIAIAWKRSPSSDVVEHVLYRRIVGESAWKQMARSKDRAFTSWVDTTSTYGVSYEYSLQAIDDDGRVSLYSNAVEASPLDRRTTGTVTSVTPSVDRSAKAIVIRWNASSPSGTTVYLYKGTGSGELSLYRSIEPGTSQFADTDVTTGATYRYGVKLVADDGRESRIATSEAVEYR